MSDRVDPNKFDRCSHCGATFAPGTKQCPSCGTPTVEKNPARSPVQRLFGWRHLRHLLIVLILLLLPHVPQVWNYVPFRVLLSTSPLVLEAVTRANDHPETEAMLGRPVSASWLSRGYVYLFPESYYAKKPVDGALIKFRDAQGQTIKLERSDHRTLMRIISPDGRSITFEHDAADRIFQAEDDQKRKVSYLYDHGGRLAEVRGLHAVRRFDYESTYLMKVEENGQRLVEFDYDRQGRISDLKLPDGRLHRFRYEYDRADAKRIVRSILTAPDGSITKFDIPPN